jgi:membrane protein required for beta-lactamase induction
MPRAAARRQPVQGERDAVNTHEAWRVLKRRSQLLWLALFASLPGMFLFSWLLDGVLRPSLLWSLVTLAFVTGIGVAGLRVARFACPRCGRPFFEN